MGLSDSSSPLGSALLQQLLGLDDEELLRITGASPLELVGGEEHPAVPILLALLDEARASTSPETLRRWIRTAAPPHGERPLDLLLRQDFAAFEDALAALGERGFVIKVDRRGPHP